MTVSTLHAAQAWHEAGFCLIRARADGTKQPYGREWTTYQRRPSTAEEIVAWFGHGHPGMGIVCGAVSGGVEMLELEGRAVEEGVYEQLLKLINDADLTELWQYIDSGYRERTPSGGYHWIYRIGDADVPGNTKLARRPATTEEIATNPDDKIKVLAETRGEGGFVVVAPSNGSTHPSGKPWTTMRGHPGSVALISLDERNQLHRVVRCLDQMPPPAQPEPARQSPIVRDGDELTPGDDYERRTSWADVLTPHGWVFISQHGHTSYWRRPGKDRGVSATTGRATDRDRLYVFSTSTLFESDKPYTRFGAYALLEHNGNYQAAARNLAQRGYGQTQIQVSARPTHPLDEPPPPADEEDPLLAEDAFWKARPVLEHVHAVARARRASPWATLGVVLVRAVVAVKPFAVLPPIVGGVASLNLFVGIVGASGDGKGAAEAAGAHAVDFGTEIEVWNLGSGEGIPHLFMHRETVRGQGKVLVQHADRVLMSAAEIDTLTALARRQGSTLMGELRKAWVGERLGFAYADPEKRLPVEAHAYRLGLVVGIQPEKADHLLDDAPGGTPQRFLWLPALDPGMPDTRPGMPDVWEWEPPSWPAANHRTRLSELPVCQTAWAAVEGNRVARNRGLKDALDSHQLLNRLKVAAALALLDVRSEVTEEDWQLAGVVQDVSNRTRAEVVATLRDSAAVANRRRGEAEADRAIVVAERVDDVAVKRVARAIQRRLSRDADRWVGRREVSHGVGGRDRPYLDEALARLLNAGQIEVDEGERDDAGRGSAVRYRAVANAP